MENNEWQRMKSGNVGIKKQGLKRIYKNINDFLNSPARSCTKTYDDLMDEVLVEIGKVREIDLAYRRMIEAKTNYEASILKKENNK
tara:strand:- start:454 stop:711 length:258 start_codon:yes stop_codon:yes gene_type:complete